MKIQHLILIGLTSTMGLIGCAVEPTASSETTKAKQIPMQENTKKIQINHSHETEASSKGCDSGKVTSGNCHTNQLIKITGIGYGAATAFANVTKGQRRLMAIRASKLDAYRALAEQIYGIKIDSNTAISTLTAKSDSFRARVNAVVRGARVVSVTPMADNNYETVLEVFVDKRFFDNTFIYSRNSAGSKDGYSSTCQNFDCNASAYGSK